MMREDGRSEHVPAGGGRADQADCGEMESTEAPYSRSGERGAAERVRDYDFQANTYRVYTTVDLNLQRAASDAVRIGMEEVDRQLSHRRLAK